MGKRRITILVDEERRHVGGLQQYLEDAWGITVESVQDIPQPVTQKFEVTIISPPELRTGASQIRSWLSQAGNYRDITVAEVTP
jgi:hypothetical protein